MAILYTHTYIPVYVCINILQQLGIARPVQVANTKTKVQGGIYSWKRKDIYIYLKVRKLQSSISKLIIINNKNTYYWNKIWNKDAVSDHALWQSKMYGWMFMAKIS